MKKVGAVIRFECLEVVSEEIRKLGYPGVTITGAMGHGKRRGLVCWRGAEYRVDFPPELKPEMVITDEELAEVMHSMTRTARSGDSQNRRYSSTRWQTRCTFSPERPGFRAI